MKCLIQWVDKTTGEPTPDDNVATCIAMCIQTGKGHPHEPEVRVFPCCLKHAKELDSLVQKHVMVSQYGTTRWVKVDFATEEL